MLDPEESMVTESESEFASTNKLLLLRRRLRRPSLAMLEELILFQLVM